MAKIVSVGSDTPKNRAIRCVMTLFIIVLTIFMVSPFIWMVSAAFKREADVMTTQLQLLPGYFYPDNFLKVLGFNSASDYHFIRSYANSIKVGVLATLVSVGSSVLAGYAFAKLKFPGSGALFILYLSQLMIPSQLTLIPRFVIFSEIGLTGTHWSLILPKVVSVSSTFMMRQAFLSVPDELRESAKIDGAGEFRTFLYEKINIETGFLLTDFHRQLHFFAPCADCIRHIHFYVKSDFSLLNSSVKRSHCIEHVKRRFSCDEFLYILIWACEHVFAAVLIDTYRQKLIDRWIYTKRIFPRNKNAFIIPDHNIRHDLKSCHAASCRMKANGVVFPLDLRIRVDPCAW